MRLVDAATFEDQPVQLGGIPVSEYVSAPHYSDDGRFVGAAFEGVGGGEDSAVAVWDWLRRNGQCCGSTFPVPATSWR